MTRTEIRGPWSSLLAWTSQAIAVSVAGAGHQGVAAGAAQPRQVRSSQVFVTATGRLDAPPIVLVHGIGSSSAYFTRLVLELARRWRVVAIDLPGFGRSPTGPRILTVREHAEVLARFLREQDLTGVVLLGHSLGAQVVAELLSTEPGDVRCAVLLAPTTDDAARNRFSQARRLAWDTLGEPLNLKFVQLFAAAACGARVWWRTSRFMLDEHIEDALEQVRVPVLLVRGERDRLASAAWPRRLSAACRGSAVAEVPGAGHVVHWSHPAEVARLCWWWGTRELATMAVGESSP